jgi:hypothetical protein
VTLETDIAEAFLTHLGAAGTSPNFTSSVTSPATPLAVPLFGYTPTAGTAYLEAHPVLRADPDTFGLSDQTALHRGIYQVDAVVPDNVGELPGLRLAEAVRDRFRYLTEILVGTVKLRVSGKPAIAPVVKDAPWCRFPVSIPYLVIK